ncbi:MAG: hypothetical protein EP330_20905 [Deltaproteobacteria bacterium]|nr:MAG: hypothetical protein EP330_20905 [Deltaproteobacteria bacterium]
MDYYSYAPMAQLSAPLFVCGLPGSEPAMTARVATMLTGLPLISVDRRVEHLASNAVELVEFREGRGARLALEAVVLDEALGRPKPQVIAGSSVTVSDPRLVSKLDVATWLLLDMSVDEAMAAMQAQVDADRRKHYAIRAGGPIDEDLRPELDALHAVLTRSTHRVAVRGRTPLEVGQELAQRLMDGL